VALTLWLGGIGTGLTDAPKVATWLFITSFLFALIGIWGLVARVESKLYRGMLLLVGVFVAAGVVLLGGRYSIRGPVELTHEQERMFTQILSTGIAIPEYTIVACPDADENACIFAAQFIPLFQRAGWKIDSPYGPKAGPMVERVRLGQPSKAVMLVDYGPPAVEPQNPDVGVWTQVSPYRQVLITAFALVGIKPETINDPNLSVKKTRIYFGSVPRNSGLSFPMHLFGL